MFEFLYIREQEKHRFFFEFRIYFHLDLLKLYTAYVL